MNFFDQKMSVYLLVVALSFISPHTLASEYDMEKFAKVLQEHFSHADASMSKEQNTRSLLPEECPKATTSGPVMIVRVPTPDPYLFASVRISVELLNEDVDMIKLAQGNGKPGFYENRCAIQSKSPFALIQHKRLFIRVDGSCQGAGIFKYEVGEVLNVVNAHFLTDAPEKLLFSSCGGIIASEFEVKAFLASLQKKWRRVGRIFPEARKTYKEKIRKHAKPGSEHGFH